MVLPSIYEFFFVPVGIPYNFGMGLKKLIMCAPKKLSKILEIEPLISQGPRLDHWTGFMVIDPPGYIYIHK